MRTLFAVLPLLVLAGCDEGFDAPSCMPGEVKLEGTLDGVDVATTVAHTGYSFVNALGSGDGELAISSGTTKLLVVKFPDLVANGDEVSARGEVHLAAPALEVGNCETGPYHGRLRMDDEGGGGKFVLKNLARPPFCSGAAVEGELRGCFRSSNR